MEISLSKQIQLNKLAFMRSHGSNLQDRILQSGQRDFRYMEIVHQLQESADSGTGAGTCTCIGGGIGTCVDGGTCSGTGIGTCSGTGIGTNLGAEDVDYRLMENILVTFRDKIYVLDSSDLKKVTLREFQVKPYSRHPRYWKTMTPIKKFYYWMNLMKDVAVLMAGCLDY